MGIGIFTPPLNSYGNSFKGIKTAVMLADELKLKQKHINFKYR
jgi:glutaminase